MTDEAALIDLQTRLTFQEQVIDELGRTLTGQQRELLALRAEVQRLLVLVRQFAPPLVAASDQEAPPPHY